MQRKTTETANFDPFTVGQRCTHLFENRFNAKLNIQVSQVPLNFGQSDRSVQI